MASEDLLPTVELVSTDLMLSQFSSRRDQYGIPIPTAHKLTAAERDSFEERGYIEEWNHNYDCLHSLGSNLASLLQESDFIERWIFDDWNNSLKPPPARAHEIIDPTHDFSLISEISCLTHRREEAIDRKQRLALFTPAIMASNLKGMEDHYPYKTGESTYLEGPTLIRVWTDKPYTAFDEDFGFRAPIEYSVNEQQTSIPSWIGRY
jgi:hypothetical protein